MKWIDFMYTESKIVVILVPKSSLTLCNPMDCGLPGSSVQGISQARMLEWVAISFSRGSSQSRDWIHVACLAGKFFTIEPPGKPKSKILLPKYYYSRPFFLSLFNLLGYSALQATDGSAGKNPPASGGDARDMDLMGLQRVGHAWVLEHPHTICIHVNYSIRKGELITA